MSSFVILALASSALAFPYAGEHAHGKHRHNNHFFPSGSGVVGTGTGTGTGTGAPYPIANATGWYVASAATASGSGFPVTAVVAPEAEVASASVSTSCSQSTAYVTETNQITVTVHRTSTDSAEATLYKKDFNQKQRSWRKNKAASTVTSSTSTTVSVASTKSTTSSKTTTTSVASSKTTSKTTSSTSVAASKTTTTSTASKTGKRGVAYNTASLTTPFEGSSEVTWGYNWGQSSSGLSSTFNYVPLLWGTGSSFTSGWAATVSAAAANGVTHLMSFNEPDLSSQSNLSPAAAAAAYKTYMQPYAGKFKLGAPAVTNGGGAMGLNWLDAFIKACDGCTIDFVSAHWYDSPTNTAYFKEHVANVSTVAGGKPVWLTEFGVTSGSDSDISTFLETVMPWMDSQSYVERYAYFMVSNGLLVNNGALSSYGSTYKTYSG